MFEEELWSCLTAQLLPIKDIVHPTNIQDNHLHIIAKADPNIRTVLGRHSFKEQVLLLVTLLLQDLLMTLFI